jgi:uncharacterized protein with PIN domain
LYACDPSTLLSGDGNQHGGERDELSVANSQLKIWRESVATASRRLEDSLAKPEKDYGGAIAKRSRDTIARLGPRVAALEASLASVASKGGGDKPPPIFSKVSELSRICVLANDAGQKTLVFCEFETSLLTMLQSELDRAGIPFATVDGDEKQMANAFERYGKGNTHVLLLHSTMFSCGVNLEMTDHIVLCHRLPDQLRVQVMGRAQRPGRSSPLAVTQLLYPKE